MAGGWASLGLMPDLVQVVEEEWNWMLPTAVQDECIPLLLGGTDIMASAETGSGKTAAFLLPILQLTIENRLLGDQDQDRDDTDGEVAKEKTRGNDNKNNNNRQKTKKKIRPRIAMSIQDRDPSIAIHPTSHGRRVQSKPLLPQKQNNTVKKTSTSTTWAGCRASMGISLPSPPPTTTVSPPPHASSPSNDRGGQQQLGGGGGIINKKYVYECKVMDDTGIVRIGWSTSDASLLLGTDNQGYGYGGTGTKFFNNHYDEYPNPSEKISFSQGDVIGCCLEIFPYSTTTSSSQGTTTTTRENPHANSETKNNKTKSSNKKNNNNQNNSTATNTPSIIGIIRFAKNGILMDKAFDIRNVTTNMGGRHNKKNITGDISLGEPPKSLYPTICLKNAECELNFGDSQEDRPFAYSYEGYVPIGEVITDLQNWDMGISVVNPNDSTAMAMALSWTSSNGDDDDDDDDEEDKDKDDHHGTTTTTSINNDNHKGPFAIIIEPARDLAQQTFGVLQELMNSVPSDSECRIIQPALLVGGVKPTSTINLLQNDKVDILVGTPPIISSFMKKGIISSSQCRFLCLDEADELIMKDSEEHIRTIYARVLASNSSSSSSIGGSPNHQSFSSSSFTRLQVAFFSATLHDPKVQALAEKICHRPMWVDLRGKNESTMTDTVHHVIVNVPPINDTGTNNNKDDTIIKNIVTDAIHRNGSLKQSTEYKTLSKAELDSERIKLTKPQVLLKILEQFAMDQVLIFCRTNLDCDLMEQFFHKIGGGGGGNGGLVNRYSCRVLAGMRSMEERETSLREFKQGGIRILIATDLAARGIDIRELPFVINYTLPDSPETYVHRIGRVGRAERMGLAVSLVSTVNERVWFCRKPNKPPCADTRDFDKGGNCIWYSEPKLILQVEKHLSKNKITATKLSWPDMEVPQKVMSMLETKGYGNLVGGSTVDLELENQLKSIQSSIREVESTEKRLQNNYWKLRLKFQ